LRSAFLACVLGPPIALLAHSARAILQSNGVLYFSTPDTAWALDAQDGHEIWHFFWKAKGGTHVGNCGVALYEDTVLFETPNDFLIVLETHTGKERWHEEIASFCNTSPPWHQC
jgi:alcohol dehydrogenase (cytochrome c)